MSVVSKGFSCFGCVRVLANCGPEKLRCNGGDVETLMLLESVRASRSTEGAMSFAEVAAMIVLMVFEEEWLVLMHNKICTDSWRVKLLLYDSFSRLLLSLPVSDLPQPGGTFTVPPTPAFRLQYLGAA